MAEDKDKPDKPLDDNETLVKALESIKSLLATSETKLSQARESINQASAKSLKMTRDVPVLDNVIVPGKSPAGENPPPEEKKPPRPSQRPSAKPDLASYQAELEQEMRDKLSSYASQLEAELKAKIQNFLDKDASD